MVSVRLIRRKIRTVRNIRQITDAMKRVAAARLQRAQHRVEAPLGDVREQHVLLVRHAQAAAPIT